MHKDNYVKSIRNCFADILRQVYYQISDNYKTVREEKSQTRGLEFISNVSYINAEHRYFSN